MPFKPGESGNRNGRPALTPELRAAREALGKITPKAVKTLYDLLDCEDDSVRSRVALGIIKATLGEVVRAPIDEDGKTVGKVDAEEIAKRARELIAARLLVTKP